MSKKMKLSLLICLITIIATIQCIKILGIFPLPSKSHHILSSSLMCGLAEKGHNITVISSFGETCFPKNGSYRDVVLTGAKTVDDKEHFDLFQVEQMNFVVYNLMMNGIGSGLVELTLNNPNVQQLLKSEEHFDVVIVEQFVDDALKAFAHHYQAPLVLFVTFGSNSWINPLVANPAPPSYVPEQTINFNKNSFFHRLQNTLMCIFGELNRHLLFFPQQNKIMKKYFPNAPDIDDLLFNASLVLLNSHISTNKAVPRVPCMIDIGGFHIKPPKKLPKDLQEYLDDAPDGVIYFSMGSNLRSVNLPVEKRDAILQVFSKLKQKVLWKWEDEELPGQPENVKLRKWLPQQDILAHPNIRAFITHGGLLSITESVYHGVPMVAIPVFGDQIINAIEIANNELGRYVLYAGLNEEKLAEAVKDVLHDPKYKDNMKTRRKIMHDRRNNPMDDADYWIQYVVRHQGATHLRVDGLELSWYQYLGLDVAFFLLGSLLLLFYVMYVLSIVLINFCRRKTERKVKSN